MGADAIDVYRQMPANIRDEVSHICVMNACSHAGLVDEARTIFDAVGRKTEKIIGTMVRSLMDDGSESSSMQFLI